MGSPRQNNNVNKLPQSHEAATVKSSSVDKPRRLKVCAKQLLKLNVVFGLLLIIAMAATLTVYGINVYHESEINRIGRKTLLLSEDNKETQLQLHKLHSFESIQAAAQRASYLKMPTEDMTVATQTQLQLPKLPVRTGQLPNAYGY